MATNLGLTRMAAACGIPYEVLHWTQEWYVREETLREANTCIVNHHHSLELAQGVRRRHDVFLRRPAFPVGASR